MIEDWEKILLGKLASKITKGSTPTTYGFKYLQQGINFIKIENVKNGVIDVNGIYQFISKEAHEHQKRSQLESGDVLFSIAGTIGETCIIKKEHLPANTNQAFAIISGFNAALNARFLRLQLDSFVSRKVKSKARGGAMNNVSLGNLKELEVELPPLPIQRAIVSKIESLFSSLDSGIADLKKAQEQLKIYRQAVLKKAFEGELTKEWREQQTNLPSAEELLDQIKKDRENYVQTNLDTWQENIAKWKENGKEKEKPTKPKFLKEIDSFTQDEIGNLPQMNKYWVWTKIDNIAFHKANSLKAGPFGSSLKKEFYKQKGYKIYGQEQVISGDHKIGDYYVDQEKYDSLINCATQPNDILISLVGTVGKVLVLPEDCKEGIINPRLVKITPNKYYDPMFFKLYFESAFLKSIYKLKAHGATMDILNLGIIKELPYPLCSLTEQKQILKEIESRLSVCDKVEQDIKESLEKSQALRQSILKKAFEGKLLTAAEIERCKQEADYEPASVLLKRIKKEKTMKK